MGIKGLSQFLKKFEVHETLDVTILKYTKIAIDTPMFLYKFKSVCEPNSDDWLGQFINLVVFLRKHDIHPVFLFEGKAPPEKAVAQEERKQQRQKMVDKTNAIEHDLNIYINNGTITPLLCEIWEKTKKKRSLTMLKTLARTTTIIDIGTVKAEVNRRRRYEISITSEDISNLKELLDIMGVSYIQSDGEAETDCISLFYSGIVDYIVAEDTDVLAYFYPQNIDRELKVIIDFNINNLSFVQISKQKVLNTINLTSESFRDFCIMCGTDYNKNIFRVGVETSYKYICRHYNLENVPLDVAILNHKRIREIFMVKENLKLVKYVRWCKVPSTTFVDKLSLFILAHNLKNLNVDQIFYALSEANVEVI